MSLAMSLLLLGGAPAVVAQGDTADECPVPSAGVSTASVCPDETHLATVFPAELDSKPFDFVDIKSGADVLEQLGADFAGALLAATGAGIEDVSTGFGGWSSKDDGWQLLVSALEVGGVDPGLFRSTYEEMWLPNAIASQFEQPLVEDVEVGGRLVSRIVDQANPENFIEFVYFGPGTVWEILVDKPILSLAEDLLSQLP